MLLGVQSTHKDGISILLYYLLIKIENLINYCLYYFRKVRIMKLLMQLPAKYSVLTFFPHPVLVITRNLIICIIFFSFMCVAVTFFLKIILEQGRPESAIHFHDLSIPEEKHNSARQSYIFLIQ